MTNLTNEHVLIEIELESYPDPTHADWTCSCGKVGTCKPRWAGDDLTLTAERNHRVHIKKMEKAVAAGREVKKMRKGNRKAS